MCWGFDGELVGACECGGEFDAGFVEFCDGFFECFSGGGFAVPSAALEGWAAPALDCGGDDGDWFGVGVCGYFCEAVEGGFDLVWCVAVDGDDFEAEGDELGGHGFWRLLVGDAVCLAVLVAVDDGADIGEFVIDDEVHGFCDLSFACFAVADDAVDSSVEVVEACGFGDSGGDGEALAE